MITKRLRARSRILERASEALPTWIDAAQWQALLQLTDAFDTARVAGVEIDISGVDDAFGFTPDGVGTPLPNMLQQRVLRPLAGRWLPCQRLSDLIAYETLIGRAADLAELARLRA